MESLHCSKSRLYVNTVVAKPPLGLNRVKSVRSENVRATSALTSSGTPDLSNYLEPFPGIGSVVFPSINNSSMTGSTLRLYHTVVNEATVAGSPFNHVTCEIYPRDAK